MFDRRPQSSHFKVENTFLSDGVIGSEVGEAYVLTEGLKLDKEIMYDM